MIIPSIESKFKSMSVENLIFSKVHVRRSRFHAETKNSGRQIFQILIYRKLRVKKSEE